MKRDNSNLVDRYLAKPVLLRDLSELLASYLPIVKSKDISLECGHPAPDTPLVKRSALHELTGGDPEVEAEILAEFIAANREDMQRIMAAFDAKDFIAVAEQAHRIKGASRTVGAMRLAAIAEQLESAAGQQKPNLRTLLDELANEASRIQ